MELIRNRKTVSFYPPYICFATVCNSEGLMSPDVFCHLLLMVEMIALLYCSADLYSWFTPKCVWHIYGSAADNNHESRWGFGNALEKIVCLFFHASCVATVLIAAGRKSMTGEHSGSGWFTGFLYSVLELVLPWAGFDYMGFNTAQFGCL